MISAATNASFSKPLAQQKKPDFVCEPGDSRVKKFGWTKEKFQGYLSIEPEKKVIWVSSIWSIHMGKGNYSRMVRRIHKAGFIIKVPSPFPRMEAICKHLNFVKTSEFFEQIGEDVDVWVMPA